MRNFSHGKAFILKVVGYGTWIYLLTLPNVSSHHYYLHLLMGKLRLGG